MLPQVIGPAARPPILPPTGAPILIGALVFLGLYMAYEIYRWVSGNKAMLTPGQFRRRLAAGFILELDLLLWLLAYHFFQAGTAHNLSRAEIARVLVYLGFATLLAFIPMIMAVREAAFIMRQYARWRGDVVRNLGKAERRGENGSSP